MVDMNRVEVTRDPREGDDVGFRDRPGWAFPLIARREVMVGQSCDCMFGHQSPHSGSKRFPWSLEKNDEIANNLGMNCARC